MNGADHDTSHEILEVEFQGDDCILVTECGKRFILSRERLIREPFIIVPVPAPIKQCILETENSFEVTVHQSLHDKITSWLKEGSTTEEPEDIKPSSLFGRLMVFLHNKFKKQRLRDL